MFNSVTTLALPKILISSNFMKLLGVLSCFLTNWYLALCSLWNRPRLSVGSQKEACRSSWGPLANNYSQHSVNFGWSLTHAQHSSTIFPFPKSEWLFYRYLLGLAAEDGEKVWNTTLWWEWRIRVSCVGRGCIIKLVFRVGHNAE